MVQLPGTIQVSYGLRMTCLIAPDHQEIRLNKLPFSWLLGKLIWLFTELSATDIGKNPLSKEVDRLNNLYLRWIVQIDDLVNIV